MAEFPCPQCSERMYIEAVHEGYMVPCPHCSNRFFVPVGASADDYVAPEPEPESEPDPPSSPDVVDVGTPPPLPDGPAGRSDVEITERRTLVVPPPRRPNKLPAVPEPRASGTSNSATMVFVLGLLSLVICGFLGPVAWIMGHNQRLDDKRAGRESDPLLTAGWALGIASTILLGLTLLCIIPFAFLGALG